VRGFYCVYAFIDSGDGTWPAAEIVDNRLIALTIRSVQLTSEDIGRCDRREIGGHGLLLKFAGAEIPRRRGPTCDVTNSLDVGLEGCVDVTAPNTYTSDGVPHESTFATG
jgi:hypothetical protein